MIGDLLSSMRGAVGRALGIGELCEQIRGSGRAARVVARSDVTWLSQSIWSSDDHLIALDDAPIDLLSVRFGGTTGPRQSLSNPSFSLSVGGLPVMGRKVLPIQYHFIVRAVPRSSAKTRTRLHQSTKNFFRRERTGMRWEGSALALGLNLDAALTRNLEDLTLDDALDVRPEPENGLSRVVLHRHLVFDYSLFKDDVVAIHRRGLSPGLLDAIERLAEYVRGARP